MTASATPAAGVIQIKRRDGVFVLTLNRPAVLNALTEDQLRELADLVTTASRDSSVRTLVITGAGRAFSAGGDVRALQSMPRSEREPYLAAYSALNDAIEAADLPVIAALNGATYGGGLELACMADVRVADPSAEMCVGDAPLGLVPTGGLTWALPRLVGEGRARWMVLTNARVDPQQALAIGLCDVVSPPGQAQEYAIRLAQQIGRYPRAGLAASRKAVRNSWSVDRRAASEREVSANLALLEEPDTVRALAKAFPLGTSNNTAGGDHVFQS